MNAQKYPRTIFPSPCDNYMNKLYLKWFYPVLYNFAVYYTILFIWIKNSIWFLCLYSYKYKKNRMKYHKYFIRLSIFTSFFVLQTLLTMSLHLYNLNDYLQEYREQVYLPCTSLLVVCIYIKMSFLLLL